MYGEDYALPLIIPQSTAIAMSAVLLKLLQHMKCLLSLPNQFSVSFPLSCCYVQVKYILNMQVYVVRTREVIPHDIVIAMHSSLHTAKMVHFTDDMLELVLTSS